MSDAIDWPRLVRLALINTVLWWVLSGGGWGFGVVAVALATALGLAMPAAEPVRYSLPGALRFAEYFLRQSILGGIDVAYRAFAPSLPLVLSWQHYPLRLRGAPARTLFINAISLLPGTLSAELRGDIVLVHGLTPESLQELATLETRVGGLFGQTLEENPS